jgi:protoheme ferro-lyase
MKCESGKHEWQNESDAKKCCNGYIMLHVNKREDIHPGVSLSEISFTETGYRYWYPLYPIEAVEKLDLDDKESIIDLLFTVQEGYVSCRRAASEIMKKVEEIKKGR